MKAGETLAKGKYRQWLMPDGLTLLAGWARDGLTDVQIAKNMGISRDTLYEWKKKYPDISDTLKKGKEIADYEVENALYKRATGYEYKERVQDIIKNNATGEIEKSRIRIIERHVPPDTTAQIYWLKNRQPAKWGDRKEKAGSTDAETASPMQQLVNSINEASRIRKGKGESGDE